MEKLYLSELVGKPVKQQVCVHVLRKWIFDGNRNDGSVLLIGLVLVDEKGDSIYGQISRQEIESKGYLIEAGRTYLIGKFNVRTSKPEYVPFKRQYMMEFTPYTTIKEVKNPPDRFPAYVYTISQYSELDPVTSSRNYVDVLGILVSYGNLEPKTLKDGQTVSMMREVIIKNLSDEELRVTLWGQHATQFDVQRVADYEPGQSVVLLLVGCLPRIMNLRTYVTSGSAFHCYYNPDIKEAYPFYARLKQTPMQVHHPPTVTGDAIQVAQPTALEYKTLTQLTDADPFEFLGKSFKCTITVTSIPQEKKWSYIGCRRCKKAAHEIGSPFVCSSCKYTQPGPLYNFKFRGADDTGEANFLAYDDEARLMIRRNVETLTKMHRDKPGLPKEITNVVSKKFTLAIGLTMDSFDRVDMRTYTVKRILVNHELESYKTSRLLNLGAGNEASPGTSQQHAGNSNAIIQISDKTHTPPPVVDLPSKSPPLTLIQNPAAVSSTRRTLFQETVPANNEEQSIVEKSHNDSDVALSDAGSNQRRPKKSLTKQSQVPSLLATASTLNCSCSRKLNVLKPLSFILDTMPTSDEDVRKTKKMIGAFCCLLTTAFPVHPFLYKTSWFKT